MHLLLLRPLVKFIMTHHLKSLSTAGLLPGSSLVTRLFQLIVLSAEVVATSLWPGTGISLQRRDQFMAWQRDQFLAWSAHLLQQQMKVQLTDRIATADRKLARMT